jgi:hypothetical protein
MSSEFAVVRVFTNDVEAGAVRSLLESRGLDAFVWTDDAGGAYPFLQPTWGVRLVVPREQLDDALAILAEAETDAPGEEGSAQRPAKTGGDTS